MRYPASEKLEIIRLVERSHLPVKRTLDKLGIVRTTFYRWYDHYQIGGPEGLEDQSPRPSRVWNSIPDDVRQRIVDHLFNPLIGPPLANDFGLGFLILLRDIPSSGSLRPNIWRRVRYGFGGVHDLDGARYDHRLASVLIQRRLA